MALCHPFPLNPTEPNISEPLASTSPKITVRASLKCSWPFCFENEFSAHFQAFTDSAEGGTIPCMIPTMGFDEVLDS